MTDGVAIELPESSEFCLTTLVEGGARTLVLMRDRGGRLWSLHHDDSPEPAVHSTAVRIDSAASDWDTACYEAGKLAVTDGDERLHVYAMDTGQSLLSLPEAIGFCLTPDGRYLLVFDDDRARIHDLERPDAEPMVSAAWYGDRAAGAGARASQPAWLDQPTSAAAFAHGASGEDFRLVFGCFGYVASFETRIVGDPTFRLELAGEPTFFRPGFVYDPVDICATGPGARAFVRHGYGCGLSLLTLDTNEQIDYPLASTGRRYGYFRGVVPNSDGRSAWVDTTDGPMLWRLDGGVHALPADHADAVSFRGDRLLCQSESDGRLLVTRTVSGR